MATQPIFDDVKPWPTQDAGNPRAVIGGNQPPLEERIPAEFRAALLEEQADFYQKLDDLLGKGDRNSEAYVSGSVDRAKCTTEDEFARCGVLINILRKARQRVEKVHKEQKDPHLTAGRLVDAQKNALVGLLDGGAAIVEELQREYAREQKRIRDAEDAKRLEEQRAIDAQRAELEALAKENGLEEALPPPPEPVFVPVARPAPIRTDGATVSTGLEWQIDAVDVVKAIKHCKANTKVVEAVTAAMKALVKSTDNNGRKGFAGVTAREDVKVSNR